LSTDSGKDGKILAGGLLKLTKFPHNSGGLSTQDDKQKPITAVYKDIKPRVDTRWKKTDAAALRTLKVATAQTVKPMPVPMTSKSSVRMLSEMIMRILSCSLLMPFISILEQISKPKLVTVTESMTVQLKKTSMTKIEPIKRQPDREVPLIHSPGSYKLKKEKTEHVQKNFYESHSSKLLHQVEDIDEKDIDNPQMLAEYVNDIYTYLFRLEGVYPIRENFLASQMDVTPKMRSVLLDWINEVHNQFSLELETFHLTVSMIDRYLQATSNTPRRLLQLVGVTALFTASKYEELMPPEISDFVYVTGKSQNKMCE